MLMKMQIAHVNGGKGNGVNAAVGVAVGHGRQTGPETDTPIGGSQRGAACRIGRVEMGDAAGRMEASLGHVDATWTRRGPRRGPRSVT